jgi:hypothetical protein
MEASAIEHIEPKKSFSDTLFEGKTITDSSKKLYLANLMRLNGGEIKNLNFLRFKQFVEKKKIKNTNFVSCLRSRKFFSLFNSNSNSSINAH